MRKFLPTSTTLSASTSNKGFTLIELLVVIAIIAVLSAAGLVVFSGTQKNARDSRRMADIEAISKALESHYNTTRNQYCTGSAGTYCAPQPGWFSGSSMPKDPQTNADYTGLPTDGATVYNVCASLEASASATYCRTQQQ